MMKKRQGTSESKIYPAYETTSMKNIHRENLNKISNKNYLKCAKEALKKRINITHSQGRTQT